MTMSVTSCAWTCPSTWKSTPLSRLIGAPPGYVGYDEGGQLTEAVRHRPFRVILFDEIEKAHPDVFNALLQILEDGRLTDGHGRTVDFRNTLVIMTSNLGTAEASRAPFGFGARASQQDGSARLRASVEDALRRAFRPEFLNRLDDTIVFEPLTPEQIARIVELMLRDVQERLSEHGVSITLTAAAKRWLADAGFDSKYGARPLRRAIERHIDNSLARRIIAGDFVDGDEVSVDVDGDGLAFSKTLAAADAEIGDAAHASDAGAGDKMGTAA